MACRSDGVLDGVFPVFTREGGELSVFRWALEELDGDVPVLGLKMLRHENGLGLQRSATL